MEETRDVTVGVLALQGDFDAHLQTIRKLGLHAKEVRSQRDLEEVDALILPGGESTTIGKLLARTGLDVAIRDRGQAGMPIYGTCAGMILLAHTIEGRPEQPTLDLMDIAVARNAFGRQIESFEADIPFDFGAEVVPIRAVFIRAPYVTKVGPDVRILSKFQDKIVAVRQGNLLATAFHPELTDNLRLHALVAEMARNYRASRG
ncbi:pyridoxal phosphate synthase yaaE subunit [Chthonomonas calidirosea]|uniref:Pyridoxal 5'-phosphate synthase subunit PdxT n=1 Tax=Chthonomonas calidirosea (strain DSM 23976 / ICMP 18418 / T49) TaxID=1303518 RepID=S0ESW8_CHTCT|nr:pyridoxal 5'-phosphate synthase glutaminase subunit PdxT [Chthonomonas calidirosea]CCW34105.1 pyridoxal phosphate synthase yaaE subunit [Chthonomonas calidirosea T49]CEK15743.1 pyridoxal phosphate synthase yaaE subunit [Chthonomonas calidirosea]